LCRILTNTSRSLQSCTTFQLKQEVGFQVKNEKDAKNNTTFTYFLRRTECSKLCPEHFPTVYCRIPWFKTEKSRIYVPFFSTAMFQACTCYIQVLRRRQALKWRIPGTASTNSLQCAYTGVWWGHGRRLKPSGFGSQHAEP